MAWSLSNLITLCGMCLASTTKNLENNTIIRKKAQTTNFTTANNVSSASISLFVVNAGNILKFGLIQFEGRSRNKWYTLGYVKNRIFRVT